MAALALSVGLTLSGVAGCSRQPSVNAKATEEAQKAVKSGKIEIKDFNVSDDRGTTHIRVISPKNLDGKLVPAVFLAPAGTRLFHGNAISNGDNAEAVPYALAGMIAVIYELDGDLDSDQPTDKQVKAAMHAFRVSDAGFRNAEQAIDYAVTSIRGVDKNRIFVAGHSSAANVAIHVAANDPRIKGCAAFAACGDVLGRLGEIVPELEKMEKGEKDFLSRTAPINEIAKVKCPILLFHAEDDSNVPFSDHERLSAKVGGRTDLLNIVVAKGDHYDSMIKEGIPAAIKWFNGESGHGIAKQ